MSGFPIWTRVGQLEVISEDVIDLAAGTSFILLNVRKSCYTSTSDERRNLVRSHFFACSVKLLLSETNLNLVLTYDDADDQGVSKKHKVAHVFRNSRSLVPRNNFGSYFEKFCGVYCFSCCEKGNKIVWYC